MPPAPGTPLRPLWAPFEPRSTMSGHPPAGAGRASRDVVGTDYLAAYSSCIHCLRTFRAQAHLPLLSAESECTKSAG